MEGVPDVVGGLFESQSGLMTTIPEADVVPGDYCITRRCDCQPGESAG